MNDKKTPTLLIKNARIVTPDGTLENVALVIKGSRIVSVVDKSHDAGTKIDDPSTSMREIDLRGATLLPGFVDLHIHGAVGVDVVSADAEGLSKVAKYLAGQGTTTWLPTFVPARDEEYESAIRAIDEVMTRQAEDANNSHQAAFGARVAGVHYEGPFVNREMRGALRSVYFKDYTDARDVDFMRKLRSSNAVHFTTIAPEIPNGIELTKELIRRGFIISIGHTRADVATLDEACAAGARHVTHLYNAMTGLHHRAPGVVGWALTKPEMTCEVIADLLHVDEFALQIALKCKGVERMVLVSDAVAPTGLGDGEYEFWDETIKVINGKTENERGGLAGSVITILDAVRVMLKLDVPLVDVARMAATNPARVLGIDAETGSIETGKRADLVAVDDAGNVRMTLVGGRVAFEV
ncbi:MAG: N-acetylglucosamine-6-phosphate deacetylase [Pyrinomonadaceae bacterium MAG19_C2-C3]|nr:N-acetylglucosamine-6-phosphate deacetylase [Pyrinomonadaceae bacterium MAG19_C2-C3]